jgi:hypothetical protein
MYLRMYAVVSTKAVFALLENMFSLSPISADLVDIDYLAVAAKAVRITAYIQRNVFSVTQLKRKGSEQ